MIVEGIADGHHVDLNRDAWRALGAELGERVLVETRGGDIIAGRVGSRGGYKIVELPRVTFGECRVRRPINPQPVSECHV